MLIMQMIEFARHVGKVGIENGIAFRLPPIPVLHDCIDRDLFFPVAMRDAQYLILRDVAVLRLKEPIGPLRKQGRVSGEAAIFMDDLIHFRTVNQVIIHGMACERTQA